MQERGTFSSLETRSQSFGEPVSLQCEPHHCSSFPFTSCGKEWLEGPGVRYFFLPYGRPQGAGVGNFPSPGHLTSDKIPTG